VTNTGTGVTYTLQELAFYSWFLGSSPSLGAGGKYSDNGTFKGFAQSLPDRRHQLTSANFTSLKASMFLKLKGRLRCRIVFLCNGLSGIAVLSLLALGAGRADTLKQVTSASSQGSNDTLSWTQKGADGTILPASFTANTATANVVTVKPGGGQQRCLRSLFGKPLQLDRHRCYGWT